MPEMIGNSCKGTGEDCGEEAVFLGPIGAAG